MSENTVEKIHQSYSEVVLEAQRNRDLYLREVDLHNATLMQKHNKVVYLQNQIKELEQKLIAAEKGRRDLVVHYEQEIRNLDGCEALVKILTKKKPVDN